MNIDQARYSYCNDATFKRVVDTIEAWIGAAHVTPGEVRAAAMLACIHFENHNVRPHTTPWPDGKWLNTGDSPAEGTAP